MSIRKLLCLGFPWLCGAGVIGLGVNIASGWGISWQQEGQCFCFLCQFAELSPPPWFVSEFALFIIMGSSVFVWDLNYYRGGGEGKITRDAIMQQNSPSRLLRLCGGEIPSNSKY